MQVWFNNNDHVKVKIGPYWCKNVEWISSCRIRCAVPPGVGSFHPVSVSVEGRLPPPLALSGTKLAAMHVPAGASETMPGVYFSYHPPTILNVKPSFLLDFAQVCWSFFCLFLFVDLVVRMQQWVGDWCLASWHRCASMVNS